MNLFYDNLFFLARNYIEKEPGFLVGTISKILGWFVNLFFNFAYGFSEMHSLGLAIIMLTIFTRCLMIPLAVKQQKSMVIMQQIQPELQKIQDKYKNAATDPELQKKMTAETQKLYSKYNYNPFAGCLPMFVQLPIFFGLYYIMRNPFQFIETINEVYTSISGIIIAAMESDSSIFNDIIKPMTAEMLPNKLQLDLSSTYDFNKVLNKMSLEQWDMVLNAVNSSELAPLMEKKQAIEYFLGINLTEKAGFAYNRNLIIVVLSGFTTFLSSWLMTRKNKTTNPTVASQQRTMTIVMPLMMAWVTTGLPCGVGLYWITSNIFQIIQQQVLTAIFSKQLENPKEDTKETKKGGKK